jgi:hypothetical protein
VAAFIQIAIDVLTFGMCGRGSHPDKSGQAPILLTGKKSAFKVWLGGRLYANDEVVFLLNRGLKGACESAQSLQLEYGMNTRATVFDGWDQVREATLIGR